MHQKSFGGRASPGPAGEAYSTSPNTLAGFVGKGGEKGERREEKREGRGRRMGERKGTGYEMGRARKWRGGKGN